MQTIMSQSVKWGTGIEGRKTERNANEDRPTIIRKKSRNCALKRPLPTDTTCKSPTKIIYTILKK